MKKRNILLILPLLLTSCSSSSSHFEKGYIKEPLYFAYPNIGGIYSFSVFNKESSKMIYDTYFKNVKFDTTLKEEKSDVNDYVIYQFLYGYNDELDIYIYSDSLCVLKSERSYYSSFIDLSLDEIATLRRENATLYDKADFWNKVNSGENE